MKPGSTRTRAGPPAAWRSFLGLWMTWVVAGLAWTGFGDIRAQTPVALGADEFRAAFLSKIPGFVTWPESALGPSDESLTVVLLGDVSFGPLLEGLLKGVRVEDRPVKVVSVESIETLDDLPKCQILFVSESRTSDLPRILDARRSGLLTIGEEGGFTRKGGVMNLSATERKLTVNVRNARAAGLGIQSRLLRIAEVER
ncbi:MAG: YfiR family protein [Limisphaerales bacterium]